MSSLNRSFRICIALALILASVISAKATDYFWGNLPSPPPGPVYWNDPDNWTDNTGATIGSFPDSSSDRVNLRGSFTPNITLGSDITIGSIAISENYEINTGIYQLNLESGFNAYGEGGPSQGDVGPLQGQITIDGSNGGGISLYNSSSALNETLDNFANLTFYDSSSGDSANITNEASGIITFYGTSSGAAAGITNGGIINLNDSSSLGTATGSLILNNNNNTINFNDSSDAGSKSVNNNVNALMAFFGSSTLFNASINNSGAITFNDTATAGAGTITSSNAGANVTFKDSSSAGTANLSIFGGSLIFTGSGSNPAVFSTAGQSTITNASFITFQNYATSGSAQITNQTGGTISFYNHSTLGTAYINNGGTQVSFNDSSNAGTSSTAKIDNGGPLIFNDGSSAGFVTLQNNAGGTVTFNSNSSAGSALLNNNNSGSIVFTESSTAGSATLNNSAGSQGTVFYESSTAGNATITNDNSTISGNGLQFQGFSTSGSAHITNNSDGGISYKDNSSAGNATISNNGGIQFSDSSNAANATINNSVGAGGGNNGLSFFGNSTAGSATLNNMAGGGIAFNGNSDAGTANITDTVAGSAGASATINFNDNSSASHSSITTNNNAQMDFGDSSTAGHATITINDSSIVTFHGSSTGGNAVFSTTGADGTLVFKGSSTAAGATITTNGATYFEGSADGGTARAITNGNGVFDISQLTNGGMNVGSIEGSGLYDLGGNTLTVGGNNLSTVVSGVISDSGMVSGIGGSLVKTGTGTLTLSGTNTYTGTTTINGGVLQIGTTAATGSIAGGAVGISTGGTLTLVNVNGNAFSNNISNGVSGVGTLNVNSANPMTISGVLSDGAAGQLGLMQSGTGTTTLTNSNTYTGSTTIINGGTLNASMAGALPTLTAVTMDQTGTGGSTLMLGTSQTIASLAGAASSNVNLNGNTLTVGNSLGGPATTFAGTISTTAGPGGLLKVGTSTLILSGNNTLGSTNVNGGTLAVDGSINGDRALVSSGGTLAGTGTLYGGAEVAAGANLNPGDVSTPGTLTLGTLILDAGSTTTLRLANPNFVGSGVNDLVNVITSLTLGGTLNVVKLPGFSIGTYTLFTDSAGTSGTFTGAINGLAGYSTSISTAGNVVDLVVALGTAQNWDSTTTTGTGIVTGGAGNWNATATNWTTPTGFGNSTWGGGTALFSGSGGTVTLTSAISAQGLIFSGTGYALSGTNTLTLAGATPTIDVAAVGTTATINVKLAGTAGLTANGAGTLILANAANTYTGGTTISGGTVQIGTATVAGSLGGGAIEIGNGGTLTLLDMNGSAFAANVSNGLAGVGTLKVGFKTAFTLSGRLTDGAAGQLGLTQTGTGTTILTNAGNTYSGTTTVSSGILQIGATTTPGSLGATSAVRLGPGGTLSLVNVQGNVLANNITGIGSTDLVSVNSTNNLTLSGSISDGGSGVMSFSKSGTGTAILSGSLGYSGPTTVSAGALQFGNGTNGFTGTGNVTISGTATLAMDLADTSIFAPTIALSGTGATLKGLGSVNTTNTLSGVISGTGVFDQNGAGRIILNKAETYTGATTVNAGTLEVDGSLAAASTVALASGGTLTGSGTINGKAAVTGNGNLDFNGVVAQTLTVTGGNWNGMGTVGGLVTASGTGNTFTINGNLTATSGLAVTGGTIAGTGTLTGNLNYTSSTNSTFGGVIADGAAPSTLTMNKASSTLTLTGTNAYTGATTIGAGTLQLGDGNTTGTSLGSGNITISGTGILALNLPTASTFSRNVNVTSAGATVKTIQAGINTISGVISGLGGLNQIGLGATIVTGAESYTGVTSVTTGILQVDSSLAAGSTVNVAAAGTLAGVGTVAGTVNVLSGGNLDAGDSTGPGTLIVGKLVLNAGSNANFRLAVPGTTGSGVNDLISVTGSLTIAGNLNVTELTGFNIGSYTLFTYDGTLTNTGFSSINGTGGFVGSVSTGVAHQVNLVISGTAVTQYWDGTGAVNNGVISGGSGTWNNTTNNWTNSSGSTNSVWQGGTAVFGTPGGTVTVAAPISVQGLIFGSTGYTLSGSSALNLVGTLVAPPAISVSNGGTTATIAAPLTGKSGMSASGAGTLILTSMTNSYTGGTNISSGVVQVGTTAAAGSIGGGTISIASGGALTVVNLHGNVLSNDVTNGVAGTGTLNMSSTATNTLSGALTDGTTGQLALTQSGTGTTILTNAGNAFSGATTISKGALQIGTATFAGSLEAGSVVSVGPAATLSLVNLSGNILANDISDGLSGTGLVSINSTTNLTLSGVLTNGAGMLALAKAGIGTTILSGTDTYTGGTTVSAGTLQIGNGTTGNLTGVTGVTAAGTGTLTTDLANGDTFSNTVTDNSHVIAIGAANNYTVSSLISGTGNFTKTGGNVVTVIGANTYKGGTTINGGTLLVDNTTGSGTGSGAVVINTGATLGGAGKISGAMTLNNGGTIAPGAGTPGTTLTATSLLWNGGGTLTLQLGLTTGDAIALTGAFTKGTAGAYTVDILDDGGITHGSYTVATFASTTFAPTNFTLDMPAGYTGQLVEGSNSLTLTVLTGSGQQPARSEDAELVVSGDSGGPPAQTAGFASDSSTTSSLTVTPTPEPGSALLLAFGGAALLGWRRRSRG